MAGPLGGLTVVAVVVNGLIKRFGNGGTCNASFSLCCAVLPVVCGCGEPLILRVAEDKSRSVFFSPFFL